MNSCSGRTNPPAASCALVVAATMVGRSFIRPGAPQENLSGGTLIAMICNRNRLSARSVTSRSASDRDCCDGLSRNGMQASGEVAVVEEALPIDGTPGRGTSRLRGYRRDARGAARHVIAKLTLADQSAAKARNWWLVLVSKRLKRMPKSHSAVACSRLKLHLGRRQRRPCGCRRGQA